MFSTDMRSDRTANREETLRRKAGAVGVGVRTLLANMRRAKLRASTVSPLRYRWTQLHFGTRWKRTGTRWSPKKVHLTRLVNTHPSQMSHTHTHSMTIMN